jgi:hypothetical protein
VIVPKSPSAAENTAAANLAARFGYETTALTLPIVVTTTGQATKSCPAEKATLWVGREALPAGAAAIADQEIAQFQIGEGGVFSVTGGLLGDCQNDQRSPRKPDLSMFVAALRTASNIRLPFHGIVKSSGQPVNLKVRVSEGPEERAEIKQQLVDMLKLAGADPAQTEVMVLCTYKSGYSWLVDEIAPMLKAKGSRR